jgi:hypothetical protein
MATLTVPTTVSALDTWHRLEDLWPRLAGLLPLTLHTDREQRHVLCIGLRHLARPGHRALRAHLVNIETYGWREEHERRTLVTLLDWDGDDLVLQLMPSRTLRGWEEGDVVDQLLGAFLAGHVLSLSLARVQWRAGRMGGVQ